MLFWRVSPLSGKGLHGSIRVPGDKSISHRALMLSALAGGKIQITGLLESDDVAATRRVLAATIGTDPAGDPPQCDCGNSGTTIRLMMGLLAGRPGGAILFGDDSLNRRPMARVAEPLRKMGASIETSGGKPPVVLSGRRLVGGQFELDVASAQVKSALLLAGLHAKGETEVRMPAASRDHSERMLAYFSCPITTLEDGRTVRIKPKRLKGKNIDVPGDISSAAFLIVAAAVCDGSDISIENVGINPTRTGLPDILRLAGAGLGVSDESELCGEPRGKIRVRHRSFEGFQTGGAEIPRLIDEIPILALFAARADADESVITDAGELRVKESDRLAAISEEFARVGLTAKADGDSLVVPGRQMITGGEIDSRGDHRIAMTGAVAGLASTDGVTVKNVGCVATSFPGFAGLLRELGAVIEEWTQ